MLVYAELLTEKVYNMRTMEMKKTHINVIEGRHRVACPLILMNGGIATNTR
jgi:hypothetical protein